jgi:hypothetical protein
VNDPNPSPNPISTSLGDIAIRLSGVESKFEEGAVEVLPLESWEVGPKGRFLIDLIPAKFFKFFKAGERPIVLGDPPSILVLPADPVRRIDSEPDPENGSDRLTVETLAEVPYILLLRGLVLELKTVLALRIRLGGFDDSSSSSIGGSSSIPSEGDVVGLELIGAYCSRGALPRK